MCVFCTAIWYYNLNLNTSKCFAIKMYWPTIISISVLFRAYPAMEIIKGLPVTSYCGSSYCQKTGQKIVESLSQELNPCDDFYEYACGGWMAKHPVPDNESQFSDASMIYESTKLSVQRMLNSDSDHLNLPFEGKVKRIYNQCKNESDIENLRSKPILEYLNDAIGGWPILDPDWDSTKFDLFTVLTNIRLYLDEPLFQILVDKDQAVPIQNVITMDSPKTYAPRDVLLSDAAELYTNSYTWLLTNVTSLIFADLGKDFRDAHAITKEDLRKTVSFERDLALGGQSTMDMMDLQLMRNKTTVGDVQRNLFSRSKFGTSFTNYIQTIFDGVGLSGQTNEATPIVVRGPQFFSMLDRTLLDIEQQGVEGKRLLANYIGWKLIKGYLPTMAKDYRDAEAENDRRINAQEAKKEVTAAERCARFVTTVMPLAIGAMYVKELVPSDLKFKAQLMVTYIEAAFRELLNDSTWLDDNTKKTALEKFQFMLETVGYSDFLVNNIKEIDDEYSNVKFKSTYFETNRHSARSIGTRNLKKLLKANIRGDPTYDPVDITTPNAYYDPTENSITITAAILQSPFYDSRNPKYVNYGAIGSTLGHEITHGFDNQGSLFDDQGSMRSWWTDSTTATYNEKMEGLIAQYDSYGVNGRLTIGENIADNGGLKSAYRGYQLYRERQASPDLSLVGLEHFSFDQLFFISFAQAWCTNTRPSVEHINLLTDPHSPAKFRVNGPVTNFPIFASAFNCPVGSNMNPAEKRSIW